MLWIIVSQNAKHLNRNMGYYYLSSQYIININLEYFISNLSSKENSSMKNTLLNRSKLDEMCDICPNEKQLKITSEWFNMVKEEKLVGEVKNYINFAFKILRDLLGYDEKDINFEEGKGRGRVEFSITDGEQKNKLVIELKGQKTNLDKLQKRGKKVDLSPVDQAFGYATADKNVQWIVVSNYKELRLYNYYNRKSKFISFNAKELTDSNILKIFLSLLSKEGFIKNSLPEQILKSTILIEKDFTKDFYQFYHATRLELAKQISSMKLKLSIEQIMDNSQLILNRIIFICFAEDWNLIPAESLSKNIFSPIKDRDVAPNRNEIWRKLNLLFEDINIGKKDKRIPPYNGGLFKENLSFLKFVDIFPENKSISAAFQHKFNYIEIDEALGDYKNINPIYKNLLKMAEFNFKDETSIEILGHIFEQSIIDLEYILKVGINTAISEISIKATKKKSKSKRKKEGIFYTPEMITHEITKNSIVQYLSKKEICFSIEELLEEFTDNIDELDKRANSILIGDIACGSGAFLSQATEILSEIHHKIHELKKEKGSFKNRTMESYVFKTYQKKIHIIKDQLFGCDISPNAINIAKLSLFLKVANIMDKLPKLDSNFICGNSIISDSEVVSNPIQWDKLEKKKISVIILNPPYIPTELLNSQERDFINDNYSVSRKYDTSMVFIEKCIDLIEDGGIIGAIIPLTWQTGVNYRSYRKKIFEKLTLKKIINLPFDIFPSAYVDTAITIFEKKKPSKLDQYYAYQFKKNKSLTTIHVENWEIINMMEVLNHSENKVYCSSAFYSFERKINKLLSDKKARKLGDITNSTQGFHRGKYIREKSPFSTDYIEFYESGTAFRHFIKIDQRSFVDLSEKEKLRSFYQNPKIFIRRIINRQDRLMAFHYDKPLLTTKDYNPFVIKDDIKGISELFLTTILNSKLISFLYINSSAISLKDDFRQTDLTTLRNLPIITPDEESREFLEQKAKLLEENYLNMQNLREKITKTIKSKYKIKALTRITNLYKFDNNIILKDFSGIKLADREELIEYLDIRREKQIELINLLESTEKEIDQKIYDLYNLSSQEINLIDQRFDFWI